MTLRKHISSPLLTAATITCTMLLCLVFAPAALAYNSDAALERDGKLCTHQVTRSERKYGIPSRLLGAMAATETGRMHKGLGVRIPWPWTLNVEGKPYFFDSKTEAVAAVAKFQSQGIRSIDVGCMQINLRHHPDAFANLSEALEPKFNVTYAARFLRGHYDDTNSWKMAVGRYHSRTPAHATRYIAAVYGQWYGLASKTAESNKSAKRYKSFVRMENSGDEVVFKRKEVAVRDSKPQAKLVTPVSAKPENSVKTSARSGNTGRYDVSIIRPLSSAGKIQATPTQSSDETTNPLVMNVGAAKNFTMSSSTSISAKSNSSEDSKDRFIRFVD
ncbi:MAG: lytic transglycosylase domain-containing protein [Alphaproteobacteria bacterium]|nr:lytic transglycosylase domain-containing protein [Alphaproteobacteria bacterium]